MISNGGGDYPIWSRDGKSLLYMDANRRVMEVPYQVKGDAFAIQSPRPWAAAAIRGPTNLVNGRQYDLSADGKRLLVPIQPKDAEERPDNVHVTFLLNFFDELKRRVK
jgi:eukaryotic-like serine/threonine-protein kinase